MTTEASCSNGVIDLELWNHAYPAISALRKAAIEYMASGGWCLKEDYPKVTTQDRPWPWLEVDRFSEERPNKWSSLFGHQGQKLTQIALEDVHEFVEFRQYAISREDLRGTLLQPESLSDLAWLQHMNINHLSLNVFERAMHLGASDEDAIKAIYAEAERSILQPILQGDLIIPLAMTPFGEADAIQIDDNISVIRLTEDIQRARAQSWHSNSVHVGVLNAATHGLLIRDVTIENNNPWQRILRGEGVPADTYKDSLDQFMTSIRILSRLPIGYAQILLKPRDWADSWTLDLPSLNIVKEVRQYPDILDDGYWRRPVEAFDADLLATLPSIYRGLSTADKRLKVASRRLDMARTRPTHDDVVIDCAVGLEAMLGGDRTEMAHRIATRAAILLRHRFGVEAIYSAVRGVYNRRSEIVHGSQSDRSSTIKLPSGTMLAHHAAPFVLAELIKIAVEDPSQLNLETLDAMALTAISELAASEREAENDEGSQTD